MIIGGSVRLRKLALLCCIGFSPSLYAGVESTLKWMDESILGLSHHLVDHAKQLDAWFSNIPEGDLINNSYLKFTLSGQYHDFNSGQFDPAIKMKLHLPYTRQRWRLFFDPAQKEGRSANNKGIFQHLGLDNYYLFQHWESSLKLGLRLQLPLDPFGHAEVSRVESFLPHWRVQFKQRFYYFYQYGGGSVTELNFYHQIKEKPQHLWKISNRGEYSFHDKTWTFLPAVEWYRSVDDKNTLIYGMGGQVSVTKNQLDGYWLAMTWKHRLYQKRVFFSLRPEILFSHQHDYRPNVGLYGQVSFFFSKNGHAVNPLVFGMPYCLHLD